MHIKSLTFLSIFLLIFSFALSFALPVFAAGTVIFLTNTSANTWVVPSDWNSSVNTIEVIGGAGGGDDQATGGGGGGGGGYAKIINFSATPGDSINIHIGVGGTGGASTPGVAGGDTWFNNTATVKAGGGVGGSGKNGGLGGAGVGTVTHSGGNGGAFGGGSPPSLVAHTSVGGSHPTTSGINTTGATVLILGQSCPTSCTAPTDSLGNTWTLLSDQIAGSTAHEELWYATNPTVGASQTFTGSASDFGMSVMAFSGIAASPLDQQNGAAAPGSSLSFQTGSITPTQSNELIVSYVGGDIGGGIYSIDSSMSIANQMSFAGGSSYGQALAYSIQSSATPVNPTWTSTANDSGGATVVSFKGSASFDAGGGGGAAGPNGNGNNGGDGTSGGSLGGTGDAGSGGTGVFGNIGGNGTEWDALHGSGAGGGYYDPLFTGYNGGSYGGAGAGALGGTAGNGYQGLIVITYTPLSLSLSPSPTSPASQSVLSSAGLPWCSGPMAPGWNVSLTNGGCGGAPTQVALVQSTSTSIVASSTPYQFTHTLKLGTTDPSVEYLQQYLNSHGFVLTTNGPGSPGQETKTFGMLTYKALQRFQSTYHLPSTGFFGPLTRAVIAAQENGNK